jgi:hypothetical protein
VTARSQPHAVHVPNAGLNTFPLGKARKEWSESQFDEVMRRDCD